MNAASATLPKSANISPIARQRAQVQTIVVYQLRKTWRPEASYGLSRYVVINQQLLPAVTDP